MAQRQPQMVSLFCQAYSLNLAQSPQQGAMCGYLGNGQLLNQYQQNNGQLFSNPATIGVCPAGTFLSSNNQCLSSSTPTNPVTCSVPDGSVITPISVTVSTPSQTVSEFQL
jgi:Flp pilus assembly protein TadG